MGTPKSLNQAIINALRQRNRRADDITVEVIREHVKDFIAQKFGAAMMSAETDQASNDLRKLFDKIVGDNK